MKRTVGLFTLAIAAISGLQAETGYKVTGRYPVGGTEGWDYVTIDSSARRIYISHGSQVEVLDADTGKSVGKIPDTPGVHGIAIATGMGRGFTSNGKEDKVSIFNTTTLALIDKVAVGKGPDGIFFDSGSKRVFTNNHGSDDITAIDAATGKVVGTVKIGGAGEQMVNGLQGMLFVNMEDTHEVVSFDPATLEIKKRFTLGEAKTPTGLAFDPETNRLFVMCRSKTMVVLDGADGKIITTMPIGGGVDFAGFDPNAKLIFASNGEGSLSIFHEKSADEYEDAGTVTTQPSAKTMAFDSKTGKIFLPAATVETIPAADATKKPTRKNKDFVVLVVGK